MPDLSFFTVCPSCNGKGRIDFEWISANKITIRDTKRCDTCSGKGKALTDDAREFSRFLFDEIVDALDMPDFEELVSEFASTIDELRLEIEALRGKTDALIDVISPRGLEAHTLGLEAIPERNSSGLATYWADLESGSTNGFEAEKRDDPSQFSEEPTSSNSERVIERSTVSSTDPRDSWRSTLGVNLSDALNRLDTIETSVKSMGTSIGGISEQFEELHSQLEDLQSQLEDLEQPKSKWSFPRLSDLYGRDI